MKAWLCLNPVRLQVSGVEVSIPSGALALLCVYRTKTFGREIHGKKVEFQEVWVESDKVSKCRK